MNSSLLLTSVAAVIGFFTLFKKLRFQHKHEDEDSSSSPPPSPISSLPLSSFSPTWKYDVFSSFRGEDVRRDFLSHIQKEFQRKGITPFIDNQIKRGESIGPELKKAIRESKIAVILLSKNYASSSWCLDELVETMKCREELGQTVIAIFYKVEPSDLKRRTGDFWEVFRKTCKGKTKEVIGRWRQALAKVATVAGYHSINWDNEADMIETIANDISKRLNHSSPSSDLDTLVGMNAHMEKMEALLCFDSDQVRMIGIWGPSGIGKTTIARYMLSKHSHQFQLSTIMVNIRESYPRLCLDEYNAKLQLQNQLLSQITNYKDVNISHLGVAKERLKDKKVLVVLDGVDGIGQLDALAQNTCWFGPGSRVIITTQDLRVLKAHGVNHIYKVDFPPSHEALQIFCMYAFGQKSPKDGFEKLAWEVTNLAGNLPLGLRVMGCHFRGMCKEEWTKALPRLRTRLDGNIQSILKFSYDALDDEDKLLFLYIACFFNNHLVDRVEMHLETNFSDVTEGLNVLAEKSFISMGSGLIEMHDLLAKLGREIVRKQSMCDPGHRQFLVEATEICDILVEDAAGSRSVACINFNLNEINDELNINERAFEGMSSLQFLRFNCGRKKLHLSRGLNYLSKKLRILNWDHFPMKCLPSIVNLENLVEINMCYSELEKLWEGSRPLKNLKWMDLSWSLNLKELPSSIGDATNLEVLNLSGCSSLVEIPSSIENATNLERLILHGCSSLMKLPSLVGNDTNLWELNLKGCSSLVELPSSIGNTTNLYKLDISGCSSMVEFPPSIGNFSNLHKLDVNGCSSLIKLPSSIGNATNLQELNLSGCSNLVELPFSIGNVINLKKLDVSECSSLVELPSSIGDATNLEILYLSGCLSLEELPFSIGNATNIQELDLRGCISLLELPYSIENLTNLWKLSLSGCSNLVELPSLIGNANNFRKLNLGGCSSLVGLHFSIGNATNLHELDLSGCLSLVEFPSSIGNVTNLKKLDLSGCSSLVKFPSSIGNVTNLEKLNLSGCSSLVEFPSSIGNLTNLQELNLSGCSSLVEFPSSIANAINLKKLDLSGCSSLVEFPSSIGNVTNLQELVVSGCSNLVKFPFSIGNATNLKKLDVSGCLNLEKFPSSIGGTTNLQELNLSGCSILVEFPCPIENVTNLKILNLSGCSKLDMLCEPLEEFSYIPESITELDLSGARIEEVPQWVKGISHLCRLELNDCRKLVSIPHLPSSLKTLQADNCESLKTLDCSFYDPNIGLSFANCFKLDKKARDLIINTRSTDKVTVLPGGVLPTCFNDRAISGGLVTVKLNETQLPISLRFKVCILLINKGDDEIPCANVIYHITDAQNILYGARKRSLPPLLPDHLYIFEVEAKKTSSSELIFKLEMESDKWEIRECGVLQL